MGACIGVGIPNGASRCGWAAAAGLRLFATVEVIPESSSIPYSFQLAKVRPGRRRCDGGLPRHQHGRASACKPETSGDVGRHTMTQELE